MGFQYKTMDVIAKELNIDTIQAMGFFQQIMIKVVKYIDMPLQHISNNILSLMKRRGDKKYILNLIKKLRREVPNIKIRSTFMVGFPGETNKDFKELCSFIKKYKL